MRALLFTLTMLLAGFLSQSLAQSLMARTENNVSISQQIELDIYPNPATDYIMVDATALAGGKIEFELRSLIGNKLEFETEEIDINRFKINIRDLSTGYYFLVVREDSNRFKKAYKFLKN